MTEHIFSEADFAKCFREPHPIATFKAAIYQENERLKQLFDPLQSPAALLNEKARFIDHLITACWRHFLRADADLQALVATGGYGRSELFPHSDIDILIVLNQEFTDDVQDGLSAFSNFLWDIGLNRD